jgi:hypothetical protein
VGFEAIGDGETLVGKQLWFGGEWMVEFEKQRRYIGRHTDAAVRGCVVPFNINTCKLIAGHVVFHTMEFLEDTKEIVEVIQAHKLNTKVIYNKAELGGPPFVAPETRCLSCFIKTFSLRREQRRLLDRMPALGRP